MLCRYSLSHPKGVMLYKLEWCWTWICNHIKQSRLTLQITKLKLALMQAKLLSSVIILMMMVMSIESHEIMLVHPEISVVCSSFSRAINKLRWYLSSKQNFKIGGRGGEGGSDTGRRNKILPQKRHWITHHSSHKYTARSSPLRSFSKRRTWKAIVQVYYSSSSIGTMNWLVYKAYWKPYMGIEHQRSQ